MVVVEATASPSTQNGRSLLHTTFARSFGTRPWAQTLAWATYQAKSPLPMFNTATIGCDKGHLLGLPTSARLLAACSRALDCLSNCRPQLSLRSRRLLTYIHASIFCFIYIPAGTVAIFRLFLLHLRTLGSTIPGADAFV